ncbi:MAG: hypothetical protein KKF27_20505 [Gammaproteobacteria bacterium]|nr:hypothetical protein [Gammaproteobacteria bacterium]
MAEDFELDLTYAGLPYTAPRTWEADGVDYLSYPHAVTVGFTATVGMLLNNKANGTAVKADASSELAANTVVVRVESATRVICAQRANIWLTVSGAPTSGEVDLWLGEDGAITYVAAASGLKQKIGRVLKYDGDDTLHLCAIDPEPGLAVLGL